MHSNVLNWRFIGTRFTLGLKSLTMPGQDQPLMTSQALVRAGRTSVRQRARATRALLCHSAHNSVRQLQRSYGRGESRKTEETSEPATQSRYDEIRVHAMYIYIYFVCVYVVFTCSLQLCMKVSAAAGTTNKLWVSACVF